MACSSPTPHAAWESTSISTLFTLASTSMRMAREGARFAKGWVSESIRWSYPLGAGHGPVNPLWRVANY